uniref:TM2 domain containing 2 n=1 Tax=Fundulus heteroclitus TaxID=8078 RepID=A0A3Q2R226_FUNHE
MISVSYILLCGQFLLLLAVVFLQCLEGIHSQNSSSAAPTAAPASSPTQGASSAPFTTQPELPKDEGPVDNVTVYEYRPPSPVVLCSYLPEEFIYCQDPVDHAVNHSVLLEMGHGCARWGGQTKEEVNHTQVICTALDGIECAGAREFLRDGVPCIKSPLHPECSSLLRKLCLRCPFVSNESIRGHLRNRSGYSSFPQTTHPFIHLLLGPRTDPS